MTALLTTDGDGLLDAYRNRPGDPAAFPGAPAHRYDELLGAQEVRPGSEGLADLIDRMGASGLWGRRQAARRLVADDGISYGGSSQRRWEVDPLPVVIDAEQWTALLGDLEQRARLLDALLVDLYGPQHTLREGIVPPAAVLSHPGYLVQAHGSRLSTERQLIHLATDLARTAEGGWAVIGDRTQAPSGAGYAMANRRIVARVLPALHRRTHLARLRGFFDRMQVALAEVAPPADEAPRIALLSPGALSETAFDQAFTATLLGHPLVQSDDLTMRGGRVWRRTTGRLEPVDVLLRRVDADYCDSLDLRAGSRLGVPGMVEAERRGTLSVVNPLGSAVLENPALLPYLADASRFLLGEDLRLKHCRTYWCGDPAHRSHVLAHLESLVIRPTWRAVDNTNRFGWELSREQRAELVADIEHEPWAWAAQEPLTSSTAPVVTRSGLEPRTFVLRTFGVANDGMYHFMPGGLARVAPRPGSLLVTNLSGGLSKDVWVLAPAQAPVAPPLDLASLTRVRRSSTEIAGLGLAPRAAENLFWLGRYTERCEFTSRLLMVADNLVEDNLGRPGTPGEAATRALLDALNAVTTGVVRHSIGDPVSDLMSLIADPRATGSVPSAAQRASDSAAEVRDVLSLDTWSVLSRLDRVLRRAQDVPDDVSVQAVASDVLESLLALAGLFAESLVRDSTWAFIDAGRRIERAQLTLRLLRNTLGIERAPVVDGQVTEAVLRVCDSLITHRRRLAAGQGLGEAASSALELLVVDEINPRSIVFQIERIIENLSHIPNTGITVETRELLDRVRHLDISDLIDGQRVELCQVFIDLDQALRQLSDHMQAVYFVHQAPQRAFAVAELEEGR